MKNLCTHASGHIRPATAPVLSNFENRKAFSRKPNRILVTLLSVSLLLLSQFSTAQAPQQFSFQGVARGADGKILVNKNITIGFDIHQGSANGPAIFQEVHNTSTNANGIFNLQIGSITDLSSINWEANSYFLQTVMFYDGLPALVDLGTTQLLSVPYSLQSSKSAIASKALEADTAVVSKKWIDDEPIIQTGGSNTGSILPNVSNGNVLIWYPKNAAFRVGKNAGNNWSAATIGVGSFATGNGTLASGENSASFGKSTEASGIAAFATGNGSKALGDFSFAAGYDASASGSFSTAIGKNAIATGLEAFAIGTDSKATSIGSMAIGTSAESSGGSVALGSHSKASGISALALGHGSEATGTNSISFGNSIASGDRSFAQGEGTLAKAVHGIAIGTYNNSGDFPGLQAAATDRVFQLGHGTSAARSNALTVLRNGNIGIGNNVLVPEYVMDFGGRLRVRHNGSTAGIHFNNSQNQEDGFVGMKTDDQIGFYCNNQWQFWVDNNASYSHGSMVQVSDKRLKTNIIPFSESSLLALANLTGYHYNWLDPKRSQSRQTGLIAQEVEKYFPLLVNTDKEGYKAVNYIGLIPHLIEAVKELDQRTAEITELKKELAQAKELNKRISDLETGLKSFLTQHASATGKSQAK